MKTKAMTVLLVTAMLLTGCSAQGNHQRRQNEPVRKELSHEEKKLNTGLSATMIPMFLLIGL